MGLLTSIYNELIYRPLLNGLVLTYHLLPYPDLGAAIAVLTIAVRLILHPTLVQATRSQRAMARLEPRLREIRERFRDDREAQSRETMSLYREAGTHPLSGCIPLLVQLPILIGLYQVFWKGIALLDPSLLYGPLQSLGGFNPVAFGVFNLTERSATLALAAGASQFLSTHFTPQPQPGSGGRAMEFQRALRWQTTYFLPIIITVVSWSLPAALGFYWTALNLFAIVQQRWIERRVGHEHHLSPPRTDTREDGHPRRH